VDIRSGEQETRYPDPQAERYVLSRAGERATLRGVKRRHASRPGMYSAFALCGAVLFAALMACESAGGCPATSTPTGATSTATDVATRVSSTPPPDVTVGAAVRPPAPREFVVDEGPRTLAVDIATGATRPILTVPQALIDAAGGTNGWVSTHAYAASPDGVRVAFPCGIDGSDPVLFGPSAAICVLEAGETEARRVASQQDLVRPGQFVRPCCATDPFAWSPDGQKFVFLASVGYASVEGHGDDVYIADLEAGTVRQLLESRPHESWTRAAWSPDGSRIALQNVIGEVMDLFTVDVVSGERVDLVTSIAQRRVDPGFSWSPDGTTLAFVGRNPDDRLDSHLYVVGADRSGLRAITSRLAPWDGSSIPWSPDGRWIAATLVDGKTAQGYDIARLYAIRTDGSGELPLGHDVAAGRTVGWAPDSKGVVVWDNGCMKVEVVGPVGDADRGPAPTAAPPGPCPTSWPPNVVSFIWAADELHYYYSFAVCGQGGCSYGPLFVFDTAAGGAPRQIDDRPVYRFLGYR
jgi:WD40 repeat protein